MPSNKTVVFTLGAFGLTTSMDLCDRKIGKNGLVASKILPPLYCVKFPFDQSSPLLSHKSSEFNFHRTFPLIFTKTVFFYDKRVCFLNFESIPDGPDLFNRPFF